MKLVTSKGELDKSGNLEKTIQENAEKNVLIKKGANGVFADLTKGQAPVVPKKEGDAEKPSEDLVIAENSNTQKSMEATMLGVKALEDFAKGVQPEPEQKEPEQQEPEKVEKPISGIDGITDFAKASGAGGLPTGQPKLGGVGNEQGGPLAHVGKTSGRHDSGSLGTGGDPKPPKKKLSDDDEHDEKNMEYHKKPIEKYYTRKSYDGTAQSQRDMVAREHAQATSKLMKGEDDVMPGVGVAPPKEPEPEKPEPVKIWRQQHPESMVFYSNASDEAVVQLSKSDSSYMNGSPTVTVNSVLINQQKMCRACSQLMAKSLSVCPKCGDGATQHQVMPNTILETVTQQLESRIGPGLRPRVQEADLFLPNGVKNEG